METQNTFHNEKRSFFFVVW